jgi:hypothetical protein
MSNNLEEMKPKDFGVVALGEVLELNFATIQNPVTGANYSDLSSVIFEFTTKASRTDTDAEALATVKTGDSEMTVSGGSLRVQLFSEAISETMTVGQTYFFDGWMKETGQPARTMNLGTATKRRIIGKFRAVKPVNLTKQLT